MKNNLSIVLILAIFTALGLGCGLSGKIQKAVEGDKSSKSGDSTSKSGDTGSTTSDSGTDTESTGVPECDEVIKLIDDQMNTKDDNWATKAMKGYVFDKIKESIRESVEKNKGDKTQLAKDCKDAKKNVEKGIAETKDKEKQ
jgi:hypothetical protein